MSEEIKQEIGFDVSPAISSLEKLDGAMRSFQNRQGSSVKSMRTFNKESGKEIAALKKLTENTRLAANEWERLNKAMGKSTTTQAGARQVSTRAVSTSPQGLLTGDAAAAEMNRFMASAEASVRRNQTLWQRWSSNVRGYLGNAAQGTQQTSRTTVSAMDQMRRSLDQVTISWDTMARVVMTQAIVRALSAVRNALRASVADAIEFERSVAEIRTISSVRNLDNLKQSVRELSDQFNVPIDSASEGLYQTISNQIADGGQALEFLGSSSKFAKVGVASLDDSVNLTTGTLNAFEIGVEDAEDVMAKFFRTIQLGRTRASGLTQSFGEVAPIAHQLGITLDELQAAYATVTISGINTSKASTQLKGVLSGLIKPTKDMTSTLRGLGFESGEEIIAAYGLGGAMKLLASTTDGTSAGLAKLFPRVRGLTAAMILSGSGAGKMADNLSKIEQTAADVLNQEYDFIFDTNAETITRDVNQLKNIFTTEFGPAIVDATLAMSNMVGGVDTGASALRTMGDLAPWVVGGLGAVATAYFAVSQWAKATAVEATLAQRAMLPLAAIIAALAAADFVGKRTAASIKNAYDEAIKQEKQYAAQRENIDKRIASAEKRRLNEVLQFQRQQIAKKKSLYLEEMGAAQENYERQVDAAKSAAKRIISAYENVANKQFDIAKKANDLIQKSNDSILDKRLEAEDRVFSLKLKNESEEWKFRKLVERADKITAKAADDLAQAGAADDPEKARAKAEAAFDRADAFREQALAIAEGNEELGLQRLALDSLNRAMREREGGEKDFQKSLKHTATDAQRTGVIMSGKVKDLQELQERFVKLMEPTDGQGRLLDMDQLEKNRREAAGLIKDFMATAMGQDLPVTRMLDFSGIREQLQRQINGVDIELVRTSPQALDQLRATLQSAIDKFDLEVTIAGKLELEFASGFQIKSIEDYNKAIEEAPGKLETAAKQAANLDRVMSQQEATAKKVAAALDGQGREPQTFTSAGFGGASSTTTIPLSETDKKVNELIDGLRSLSQQERITAEDFNRLARLGREIDDEEWLVGAIGGFSEEEKAKIGSALQALKDFTVLMEATDLSFVEGSFEDAAARLQETLKLWEGYSKAAGEEQRRAAVNSEAAATNTNNLQTNLSAAVMPASQIADNMERAALASARINIAQPQSAYAGRYFASGGDARGIDSIPAMLAPNEFVINSRSSRRFFTQLQAINAGQRPVYRDSGGQVTNIGDVSITVQDSGSPQKTAREVMKAFRRESRRGSSRL